MRKRTKENVLCVTAIICLLVCIITARAVSCFHVQEMVLFSVSAVSVSYTHLTLPTTPYV